MKICNAPLLCTTFIICICIIFSNPEELNDLLNQIFNALEEEEGAETDN